MRFEEAIEPKMLLRSVIGGEEYSLNFEQKPCFVEACEAAGKCVLVEANVPEVKEP